MERRWGSEALEVKIGKNLLTMKGLKEENGNAPSPLCAQRGMTRAKAKAKAGTEDRGPLINADDYESKEDD